MKLLPTIYTIAAAIVLPTPFLLAGQLQRADLAAETAWAIQLDCDALRASALGDLINNELAKPESESKFSAFQATFNFDPRTALHGISIYALEKKPTAGVVVVYADFDAKRLEDHFKGGREYQSSTHRTRAIHSWLDEKQKGEDGQTARLYGAIAGKRVLYARQKECVTDALDVIDGFSPNLSGSKALPSMGTAAKGCFLQAAARKMETQEENPNTVLLRLAQEMRLNVVEADGKTEAALALLAKDEEVAGQMNKIAQGLLTILKLNSNKPEQAKLMDRLVLKQEGSTLTGSFAIPTTELTAMLKSGGAEKAQKTEH